MRHILLVFFGIGIVAAVAVGILAFSFDPYKATMMVKALFFTGSAVVAASLVGIVYCLIRIIINHLKK